MKDIIHAQRNKSTCVLIWVATGLPRWYSGKVNQCRKCRKGEFDPWVGKIPWRRKWQPTPVLLPGKSHGQSSLVGCGPWGRKKLGMTEHMSNQLPSTGSLVSSRSLFFIVQEVGMLKIKVLADLESDGCLLPGS